MDQDRPLTKVDEEAIGLVLERQEMAATVHFAHLTAAFLKALEADEIDHIAAIALTQEWMRSEQSVEDDG